MEIKHCVRCEKDWTYRGTGRPIRCGQCRSPYWDRERTHGTVQAKAVRVRQGRLPDGLGRAAGNSGHSDALGVPPAEAVPVPAVSSVARRARSQDVRPACPSCGGMNGLHQKGCKR